MIKHYDPGNLERGLFEDYGSKELGLRWGTVAGEHGSWSWKPRIHILTASRKWRKHTGNTVIAETSKFGPSNIWLSFLNSLTFWGPSI